MTKSMELQVVGMAFPPLFVAPKYRQGGSVLLACYEIKDIVFLCQCGPS